MCGCMYFFLLQSAIFFLNIQYICNYNLSFDLIVGCQGFFFARAELSTYSEIVQPNVLCWLLGSLIVHQAILSFSKMHVYTKLNLYYTVIIHLKYL